MCHPFGQAGLGGSGARMDSINDIGILKILLLIDIIVLSLYEYDIYE